MNKFIGDVVGLCKAIIENSRPDAKWGVVNVIREVDPKKIRESRVFTSVSHPKIPPTYRYQLVEVLDYLKEKDVVKAIDSSGDWYCGTDCVSPDNEHAYPRRFFIEGLSFKATVEGWLNHGFKKEIEANYEAFDLALDYRYYEKGHSYLANLDVFHGSYRQDQSEWDGSIQWYLDAPSGYDHAIILYDLVAMRRLVAILIGSEPDFDSKSGELRFLGQAVTFTGEKKSPQVKCLLDNINSIVSKKTFYEAGGGEAYSSYKGKYTQVHNTLNKMMVEIEKIINSNSVLAKALIIISDKRGYGIFVNKNSLE